MFIKDLSCISPQLTFDGKFFEHEIKSYTGNKYISIEPKYTNLIPAGLLRRMGRAIRIGIGCAMPLINRNPKVDGIIIGTANGGLENCINFLNQILKYNEGTLTPTNFIQSTPNSTAGHIAIMSRNNCYNITHVQKGLAFENSLLDAEMLLAEGQAKSVLVGNIEEISEYNYNIDFLAGMMKKEEVNSKTFLQSKTQGTVCGEGASMFILDTSPDNSLAEICDIDQISFPTKTEILEKIQNFLNKNNLSASEIDTLILGFNGDSRTDDYYHNVVNNLFPDTGIFTFKNLVGEYPTASAFATWLAINILQNNDIPKQIIYKKPKSTINNILIYNHYEGTKHSLILLRK